MPGHEVPGTFGPQGRSELSDEQLWDIWEECNGSTGLLARKTGLAQRHCRRRLMKIRADKGLIIERVAVKSEQLVNSLDREIDGGGVLVKASYSGWGVGAKDAISQQMIENKLDAVRAEYKFPQPDKPALVVQPYKSPIKAYAPTGIRDAQCERVLILGDQQRGFWCVFPADNPKVPTWIPFHDERAIDLELKIVSIWRPHRIVIVGDFFDFPQLSKFQQEPQWAQTLQATINDGAEYLQKLRETAGDDCKIAYILGNHEARMQRAICNNNPALYNLTKPGSNHAVYSVPFLMDFDALGIECSAEYPSGEVWLAKRNGNIPGLVVTHADPKKKDMRADSIHGHLVLPSLSTHQVFYEDGPVTYQRLCVAGSGNYSDTGDKVRLTRTNVPSGRARMAAVQSFGSVEIDRKTGLRALHSHIVTDGAVNFFGKIVESRISRS